MQSTFTLQELYRPIAPQMDEVRSLVGRIWGEAVRLVYGPESTPPAPGGKMLRPALALHSAGVLGAKNLDRFVPMAAAMELLHMAALAHDDVIDDADTRRGMRSWNAQWDNHTAVLGGDYLVARAIALLGDNYDSCAVIVNAIDSVRLMAEGELTNFGHGAASQEACISLAKKKTASLFSVTCSTPSYLLDPSGRDALHEYGLAVGIAFQLVDDVLDLVQNKETLGKPSCGDITEGKKTLPLLHLREAINADEQVRLDALQGSDVAPADCDWVADMMERTSAREQTESLARSYCEQARHVLEPFSPSPYRDAMTGLTDFVISRDW